MRLSAYTSMMGLVGVVIDALTTQTLTSSGVVTLTSTIIDEGSAASDTPNLIGPSLIQPQADSAQSAAGSPPATDEPSQVSALAVSSVLVKTSSSTVCPKKRTVVKTVYVTAAATGLNAQELGSVDFASTSTTIAIVTWSSTPASAHAQSSVISAQDASSASVTTAFDDPATHPGGPPKPTVTGNPSDFSTTTVSQNAPAATEGVKIHTVTVGYVDTASPSFPAYSPTSLAAAPADIVRFVFVAPPQGSQATTYNHSSTLSKGIDDPCTPSINGWSTGFLPVSVSEAPKMVDFTVQNSEPASFFCAQKEAGDSLSHCQHGMVFALNPASDETFGKLSANARSPPGSNQAAASSGVHQDGKSYGSTSTSTLTSLSVSVVRVTRLTSATAPVPCSPSAGAGQTSISYSTPSSSGVGGDDSGSGSSTLVLKPTVQSSQPNMGSPISTPAFSTPAFSTPAFSSVVGISGPGNGVFTSLM
jgi:hypothetical protein